MLGKLGGLGRLSWLIGSDASKGATGSDGGLACIE